MAALRRRDGQAARRDGCDPTETGVSLCGDSSGGNFALALATLVRDGLDADLQPARKTFNVRCLVLFYPALMHVPGAEHARVQETSFFIRKPVLAFFFSAYVQGGSSARERVRTLMDRRCSPCLAGLDGLPPTTLITASDDALLPSCELFAQLMTASTSTFKHRHFDGAVHGFAIIDVDSHFEQCKKDYVADMAFLL